MSAPRSSLGFLALSLLILFPFLETSDAQSSAINPSYATIESNEAKTFKQRFFCRGPKTLCFVNPNGTVEVIKTKNYGASFKSRNFYLHGIFTVWMKAPDGFSAGVISTFFMTTGGPGQDEIDMEFLGHVEPSKVLLHTNIFGKGIGGHQEGFSLWFNPSLKFHKYTIIWNKDQVTWLIDDIPIRIYNKIDPITGVENPFPVRPMTIQASVWLGSVWATQSGLVKPDYSTSPWIAQYSRFRLSRTCLYRKPRHLKCIRDSFVHPWDKKLNKTQLEMVYDIKKKYLRYSYLN